MSDAELIALPKVEFPTVKWNDIEACQFNEDMCSGTRLAKEDYWGILTSLAFLHNESCNVYPRLVGALLLLPVELASLRYLADPQCIGVSLMDYAMLRIYFLVRGDLFDPQRTLPPDASPLSPGRTILAWNGPAWYDHCDGSTFSSGIYYLFSGKRCCKACTGRL